MNRHIPPLESLMHSIFRGKCGEMSHYQLSTGGKRIRAILPVLVFDFYKQDPTLSYPIGAAAELVHNATLVHDDIQDGDETRRNQPTVWKRFSEPQAINCGDSLFQAAIELLSKAKFKPESLLKIIRLASEQTQIVIEGQAQEFLMKEESFPKIERYLEVVKGKTSGLIHFPIVASLIALDKNPALIQKIGEIANELGVLFQIKDDLIDIYGDKGRGKNAQDILEGKVSILVAIVNTVGSENDKRALNAILKKPRSETTETDISNAVSVFERYRAQAVCDELKASIENRIKNICLLDDDSEKLTEEIKSLF